MTRLIPILLMSLALAVVAPAARAQDTPFGPVPTPEPTFAPAPGEDEVGQGTLYLVGLAVLLGVVGIGYAISRDARRSLSAEDRSALEKSETTPPAVPGEVSREARARARKQRSKAKAARAARKRNR